MCYAGMYSMSSLVNSGQDDTISPDAIVSNSYGTWRKFSSLHNFDTNTSLNGC